MAVSRRPKQQQQGGAIALGGVVVATALAILSVGGVVLATQCVDGRSLFGSCKAGPEALVTAAVEPVKVTEPEGGNVTRMSKTSAATVAAAPAEPGVDQVISDTFKLLVVEEPAVPQTATAPAVPQPAAATAEPPVTAVAAIEAEDPEYEEGDGPGPIRTPEPLEFPPLAYGAENTGDGVKVAARATAEPLPAAETVASTNVEVATDEPAVITVADGPLNVRSGPSQDYKKLFSLRTGAEVRASGTSAGWVQILDDRNREGWVDPAFLDNVDVASLDQVAAPALEAEVADEPEKPAKAANARQVGGSGVNVRSGPGKSNKRVFTLAAGEDVTVLDDERGWLKIKDDRGRTGWLYKTYLR